MDKEFQNRDVEVYALLVGDGDFSFAVAFITRYSTVKLIATTLETDSVMISKYPNYSINVAYLREQGVDVITGVDATQLHQHFSYHQFTHIIFNFPHVGGKSNIKKNRELVDAFFRSASQHILESGMVLMTLCRGQGGTPADHPRREWCNSWQVTAKASNSGFVLKSVDEFEGKAWFNDYLSTGFRSQNKKFHTEGSLVHKFIRLSHCVLPPPVGNHEYIKWKTDINLYTQLVESIAQCWNLTAVSTEVSQCDLRHYSEYYCSQSTLFNSNCPMPVCLAPITYGSTYRLCKENAVVTLHVTDEEQYTVGTVTDEGQLEIHVPVILTHLFKTSDIRYFTNAHLHLGELTTLSPNNYTVDLRTPVSLYPPEYRFDISFWIPTEGYTTSNFLSLVYKNSRHLVREVILLDVYVELESNRTSHCYSVIYQSLEGALSYANAYAYYQHLRLMSVDVLNVILR